MALPHFPNQNRLFCRNCYFEFTDDPWFSNKCPYCKDVLDDPIKTTIFENTIKYNSLHLRIKKLNRLNNILLSQDSF